ncbi:hypothetical protein L202_02758 [Cryptococcus amylolentus CBS 6039]|uniref:GAR domain-containing protein n=2 Tax=Cryptococcus amylolentus TaxID=104669 RepID=A0A1E3HW61_9TREE|nr:hypothetical protein L202_02758 [Cryptococcus amylolentus CBS 6039]ODN80557.1 hypothetical protein L202_02758 [Cryptococcus amylolentus CBS 6039]ODO09136.1 hypothetical protein I350_02736 [Cryptococcus amylolentus CBS 6273]
MSEPPQLTDLPAHDAQELTAFVEKRTWFEAKLKSLEEIPPVYPFVHPSLSSSRHSDLFVKDGEDGSQWKLPDQEQVKTWRKERATIEEQVFEFDGGDLERMKEKTRAATLLPLTPPSTHLVSITLDLIVLIDRILSLLRRRGLLLDLTNLRLQWDQTRWAAMTESESLQKEVDAMVHDKARWVPVDMSTPAPVKAGRKSLGATPDTSPRTPIVRDVSSSSISSDMGTTAEGATKRRSSTASINFSSGRPIGTPDRSLHIPLLHSQLVNLRIRHKNLAKTHMSRSGALLDRMIDVASHLRDLGDTQGPVSVEADEKKEGGAVPDELLDLQDELDASVEELGEKVEWCGELEQHWKLSETHHSSSVQAEQLALTLIDELQIALARPATSSEHRRLSALLEMASKRLPSPITSSFPRPSHEAYPDNDEYNENVVRALVRTHESASEEIRKGREGLDWYARLAKAREAVLEQHKILLSEKEAIAHLVRCLDNGQDDIPRPDMDDTSCLMTEHAIWVTSVPSWVSQLTPFQESVPDTVRHGTLAVYQYRSVYKTAPKSLRESLPEEVTGDEVDVAEADLERLTELLKRSRGSATRAEQDSRILNIAQPIFTSSATVHQTGLELKSTLHIALRATTFPTSLTSHEEYSEIKEKIKLLDGMIKQDVATPLASLHFLLKECGRKLPVLRHDLAERASNLIDQQTHLRFLLDLLKRARQQREVAKAVEAEATKFMRKLGLIKDEVERVREQEKVGELQRSLEVILVRVEGLWRDVEKWEGELAERTPFLAAAPSPVDNGVIPKAAAPIPPTSSSVPPMTPPVSRSNTPQHPNSDIPIDLAAVDRNVRNIVNAHAVSVQSAIAHCRSSCQAGILDLWIIQCVQAAQMLDNSFIAWHKTNNKFLAQVENLSNRVAVPPTSVNAAKATVQAIEAMSASLEPRLRSHEKEIKEAEEALQGAVGHKPEWSRDADDVRVEEWDRAMVTATTAAADAGKQIKALDESACKLLKVAKERLERAVQNPRVLISPVAPRSLEDVFGPAASSPSSRTASPLASPLASPVDDLSSWIQQIQQELEGLQVELVVDPRSVEMQATPLLRRLPSEEVAGKIRSGLDRVAAKTKGLHVPPGHPAGASLLYLEDGLRERQSMLPRLKQLVHFSTAVKGCDAAFNSLLEVVDNYGEHQKSYLLSEHRRVETILKDVYRLAEPVEKDRRVAREVKRLSNTRKDLKALVDECMDPSKKTNFDDAASEMTRADSVLSMASTVLPRTPSRSFSRLPRLSNSAFKSRVTPNTLTTPLRVSASLQAPTQSSRNRSVSDTPNRVLFGSPGDTSSLPARARASLPLHSAGLPSLPGLPETGSRLRKSSIPMRARLPSTTSLSSLAVSPQSNGKQPPRLRRTGPLPSALGHPRVKREYVANPKNKLDVAVGKIVNKLDVAVPVRPVNQNPPHQAEEYQDLSGQYWIGSEGKAKLCFCRILRSRTVMVRVGGGWMELSKFLLDHFADLAVVPPLQPAVTGNGMRRSYSSSTSLYNMGANAPIPLTSASLAAQSAQTSLPLSHSTSTVASLLSTPAEEEVSPSHLASLPEDDPNHLSPEKKPRGSVGRAAPRTPGSVDRDKSFTSASPLSTSASPGTNGSPLMAFQFMRKAAESPSAREKEKEKFKGRRSTLGREKSQTNLRAEI